MHKPDNRRLMFTASSVEMMKMVYSPSQNGFEIPIRLTLIPSLWFMLSFLATEISRFASTSKMKLLSTIIDVPPSVPKARAEAFLRHRVVAFWVADFSIYLAISTWRYLMSAYIKRRTLLNLRASRMPTIKKIIPRSFNAKATCTIWLRRVAYSFGGLLFSLLFCSFSCAFSAVCSVSIAKRSPNVSAKTVRRRREARVKVGSHHHWQNLCGAH